MKYLLVIAFLFTCSSTLFSQRSFLLYSPDSLLRVEVQVKEKISWSLYAGGNLLVNSSSVNLFLKGSKKLTDKLPLSTHKYSESNRSVTVPVPYRKKIIAEHYKQLELNFKEPFSIQFRMYNEGFAYRVGARFKDSITVDNEEALFELDDSAAVWFAQLNKRADQDKYHTSFEAVYSKQKFASIPDTVFTYPPLTVSLPNGYHLAICDANLYDYPGMFLQKTKNGFTGSFAPYPLEEVLTGGEYPQLMVSKRENYIAKTAGTRKFPWRAILVEKNEIDLPTNDLLYLLGDPTPLKDVSWIKPAKGTDEWIIGINIFNIPFVAGLNTATYKYYIDFAKRFGFDQVMLDAGWSDVKDLFKINPNIDMEELVAYAKKNNIRLMLWTLCSTLDKQLDSALKQFNKWGVASIMTDFMDRDDQKTVNFYHRVAKSCAENKIAVMFHGAFPPKGFNRTWPNSITHEGVLGSEWNIWSELPTPEHNVAIAYTRMLAGPLDYEPGLLLNAQKDQFRPIGKNPMSMGTRSNQLAMFVVYDSPLQIFSGNISQGLLEPKFMELLGSLPTTWDDTKVLQGKIGEYIVTSRKKGNDWYIAALNNNTPRDILLPLDFLNDGNYKTTICKDGLNAHNYAADYELTENIVQKRDSVKIHLAPGGGFLLRFKKIN